jgi:hypothetical protein
MIEIAERRRRLLATAGIADVALFWPTSRFGVALAAEKGRKLSEKEVGAVQECSQRNR